MAWIKSTNTHVADWKKFETRGRSLRQLAKYGFIAGVVWGVLVVKLLYGLPGDDAREMLNCDTWACRAIK